MSEILLLNPRLSPEEVSGQITTLIEKEILPVAISRIRLPRLPSPISVRRKELIMHRYRKKDVSPLSENVGFVQDLEKLRLEYDGSDSTNEDYYTSLMDNIPMLLHEESRHDIKEREEPLPKPDIIQQSRDVLPSLKALKKIMRKPPKLITFDSNIIEKITYDPTFEKVIGEVEWGIRGNYSHETLKVYFSFSIRRDIVDSTREKTIIHISLPDSDFDEKMKYWDKIEATVRNVIKTLDVTEPERKMINRNLFTHVEPT